MFWGENYRSSLPIKKAFLKGIAEVITLDFVLRELIHPWCIRFRHDYSPALQAHELESFAFSVRTVLIAAAKTTKPPKGRLLLFFVIPVRFERTTHSLEGCCSVQLSYGTDKACFQEKC
jgi:hypothetical protein